MASIIPVDIDEGGQVTLTASGRLIGRTSAGRPPRPSEATGVEESLEVRDRRDVLVGWVTTVGDLPIFELTPNRFSRALDLDEFERLLDRYTAAQTNETLLALTMAVRQLQALEVDLEAAEQRRLAGLMGRLVDILVSQIETGLPTAEVEGGDQIPDDGLALAIFPLPVVLFQAGGTATIPVGSPKTGGSPPIQGNILSPEKLAKLRSLLTRLAGRIPFGVVGPVGLLALVYTLIAGIIYFGAAAGSAAVLRGFLRVARNIVTGVLELWGLTEEFRVARILTASAVAGFRDCFEEFKNNIQKAFDAVAAGTGVFQSEPGAILARLIRTYVDLFIRCLIRKGVPNNIAGYLGYDLLRDLVVLDVLRRLPGFVESLGKGFSSLINGIPGGRNAARDIAIAGLTSGNKDGFHRKGGFAYDEFDDDRDEAADISNEDPYENVDAALVNINPVLKLDAFDCRELFLRFKAIKRRLDELVRARDETVRLILDLLARADADRNAVRNAIAALKEISREITTLVLAQRTTLAYLASRPCSELTPREIARAEGDLRVISRDTDSLPAFKVPRDEE